jgi:outer membrane lipoprotein SlyB
MKGTNRIVGVVALIAGIGLAGCATTSDGGYSKASQNAVIGSLVGAGLGAVIGHQSGETGAGAAIGAAVGGAGGYVIGNEQDKSRNEFDKSQMRAETAQALQTANTVVINVSNSNGSITPVTLRRQGNLYVGPKGEFYPQLPTEAQLRQVYGF